MKDEILRTVRLIVPEGVVEVRALAESAVHSGYFDDPGELAKRAEVLDADPAVAGIYVTLNPVNPALLARRANRIKMRLSRKDATTSDADILSRRWLPVDIDPVRPSGVSSTDEEHDLALATAEKIAVWLAEQGFPIPIKADSGNGAHLLYRIDLPNDEAATDLVRGCLATLDALFSNEKITVDTANHNAARIWKLYGTASRKGDNTPERPHRRAKVLSVPDELTVVPVERLAHLAGLLPQDEPAPKKSGRGIDLAAWLLDHTIAVRSAKPYRGGTLYVLDDCPFSSAHKEGAFAIQFANGAIFAGCHHTSCGGGTQRWPELRARFEQRKQKQRRKEEPPTPPPAPQEDEHRRRAMEILQNGDPLGFLLDTFNKAHVGDRVVAECLAMSLASQSVENTNGLHVAISGSSGKGKSHACSTMLDLVPEDYRLKGTVSNKALYYHESLRPGMILLFDDVSLSDDLQEVLKAATANFREEIVHRTLTKDRKPQTCSIPERCVWWLAKVEAPGDDQVMNRMLTVWIDDSLSQDRAVLEHMKRIEACEEPDGDDPDVLVCRALWDVVKSRVFRVYIPFSERIRFSATQNRRNPAMLFDLIKCHARLFFLQRDRTGRGSIVADRDDFVAACRLFLALSGEGGGQETKLTRNEAAALATIARMGVDVFTIRQLQSTLGLTYHQTYRLLHGYNNSRASYAGILDKCPAVSYIDATVAEEMVGETVRRREHYFSFDRDVYRAWSAQIAIWLEDEPAGGDPHDRTFTPDSHQKTDASANKGGCRSDGDCCTEELCTDICTSTSGTLHHLPVTQRLRAGVPPSSPSDCEIQNGATTPGFRAYDCPMPEQGINRGLSGCKTECKSLQPGARLPEIASADYVPLPVAKDEPCHVCGSRPTSSVRKGSEQYLCSDCLKKAEKERARVLPLPGLLDHRKFERTKVELGRCDVCDAGKAVYRSREAQANICERCYARLVREWNRAAGVR
jgi:hypothetical protein